VRDIPKWLKVLAKLNLYFKLDLASSSFLSTWSYVINSSCLFFSVLPACPSLLLSVLSLLLFLLSVLSLLVIIRLGRSFLCKILNSTFCKNLFFSTSAQPQLLEVENPKDVDIVCWTTLHLVFFFIFFSFHSFFLNNYIIERI
jgi:hypothetical protein